MPALWSKAVPAGGLGRPRKLDSPWRGLGTIRASVPGRRRAFPVKTADPRRSRKDAGQFQREGAPSVTITKRELVMLVASKTGMTQSDVFRIVESAFDTLTQTLVRGGRWELRDFGVFEVKRRAARVGRNPRTGEQVPVSRRTVVSFKPGKMMKEKVAAGARGAEGDTQTT
ncbi:MAG: HU family DNA-binding protein [Candidatus Hydrogenedentes bacterium]|nr:HU family DNA-binding protein [Candidatus Hydrogenedentota bacterium]